MLCHASIAPPKVPVRRATTQDEPPPCKRKIRVVISEAGEQ